MVVLRFLPAFADGSCSSPFFLSPMPILLVVNDSLPALADDHGLLALLPSSSPVPAALQRECQSSSCFAFFPHLRTVFALLCQLHKFVPSLIPCVNHVSSRPQLRMIRIPCSPIPCVADLRFSSHTCGWFSSSSLFLVSLPLLLEVFVLRCHRSASSLCFAFLPAVADDIVPFVLLCRMTTLLPTVDISLPAVANVSRRCSSSLQCGSGESCSCFIAVLA
jgi:hypothetical protein